MLVLFDLFDEIGDETSKVGGLSNMPFIESVWGGSPALPVNPTPSCNICKQSRVPN